MLNLSFLTLLFIHLKDFLYSVHLPTLKFELSEISLIDSSAHSKRCNVYPPCCVQVIVQLISVGCVKSTDDHLVRDFGLFVNLWPDFRFSRVLTIC